jgi:hypothetical protein
LKERAVEILQEVGVRLLRKVAHSLFLRVPFRTFA